MPNYFSRLFNVARETQGSHGEKVSRLEEELRKLNNPEGIARWIMESVPEVQVDLMKSVPYVYPNVRAVYEACENVRHNAIAERVVAQVGEKAPDPRYRVGVELIAR